MKQAEAVLLAQRNALGGVIAPRLVNNVRRNLGLPVSGDVLDLPAYDIPDTAHAIQVHPPQSSFMDRLKAAAQVMTQMQPVQTTRQYQAAVPVIPEPTAEPKIESLQETSEPLSPTSP